LSQLCSCVQTLEAQCFQFNSCHDLGSICEGDINHQDNYS
jgi:hypothetical protein